MFIKKVLRKKYVWTSILAILFVGNYFLYTPSFDLIKNQDDYSLTGVNDERIGGNSFLEYELKPDRLVFTFQKGDAILGPYVALFFEKKDSGFFKLSDYQAHIQGTVYGGGFMDFRLEVKPEVPFKERPPYIFNQTTLISKDEKIDHVIDFDQLEIPWWWAQKHDLLDHEIPKSDLNKTVRILFNAVEGIDNKKKTTVELTMIRLEPKLTQLKIFNFLVALILVVGYVISIFIQKKKAPEKVVIAAPYNPVDMPQKFGGDDESLVIDYLSNNYMQFDLSLSKISEDTNVNQRRISEIIKVKFNLSFKQYLNNIRITEAKQLLLNTDQRVSDIGYAVGYDNPHHFLRVFKSVTASTPTDFRDTR